MKTKAFFIRVKQKIKGHNGFKQHEGGYMMTEL